MASMCEFEGSRLSMAEFCRRREVGYSSGPGHALLLTHALREGRPRIVQRPLSSGLRSMITMVIRAWLGGAGSSSSEGYQGSG
jgi:hypothetical protein